MSPLGAYPVVVAGGLGVVALGELLLSIYVVVETCILGLERRRIVRSAADVLAETILCVCLAQACHLEDREFMHTALLELFLRLPLMLVVLLLLVLGGVGVRLAISLNAVRANRITPDSVKEALDALPDGVCFSRLDGRPLLVNALMDELGHDALGSAVSDERDMWRRLSQSACQPGYTVESLGAQGQGGLLLVTPEGRAWEFDRRPLALEGETVIETVATDVTEERALALELEQRNDHLARVNQRLRSYGGDLIRLTREEEVLAAKVRVHDELGHALVALRAYERQPLDERDRAALLARWQGLTGLLYTTSPDEGRERVDAWGQLMAASRAIDVRVELEGTLPADPQLRDLAVAVVHECLNNAVRHAGAHELRVTITNEDDATCLCVTNDGAPPQAPVVPTGGLANLAALIERSGGSMETRWDPRFAVVAHLKAKEM